MKKIKILNLYCGIGGNRKLWNNDEIEVTAVELDPEIAAIYQDFFPNDDVIVADAHQYLLDHYHEYDFIWSSPPCPTHSDIRRANCLNGGCQPKFPDMKLYEEIIFLKHFFKGKWVVENVIGYYIPLIKPKVIDRHYFWSNFIISNKKSQKEVIIREVSPNDTVFGFNISQYKINNKNIDKRVILRNLVNPNTSLHIFNMAFKEKQHTLE